MAIERDGMLSQEAAAVLRARASVDHTPDWTKRLRKQLAAANSAFLGANTHAAQLVSLREAVGALLPALNKLGVDAGSRQLIVRLLFSIDALSIGQNDGLLRRAKSEGGRPAGRAMVLTRAVITSATVARIKFGEAPGEAYAGVAQYAARKGVCGHNGDLLSHNTVKKWRLNVYRHPDTLIMRSFVQPLLDMLPASLSIDQVRRLTNLQIDFLASEMLGVKRSLQAVSE